MEKISIESGQRCAIIEGNDTILLLGNEPGTINFFFLARGNPVKIRLVIAPRYPLLVTRPINTGSLVLALTSLQKTHTKKKTKNENGRSLWYTLTLGPLITWWKSKLRKGQHAFFVTRVVRSSHLDPELYLYMLVY